MSQTLAQPSRNVPDRFARTIFIFLAGSIAIHALTFRLLNPFSGDAEFRTPTQPIELVTVEVDAPKPPPPTPLEEPRPVPTKVRVKPPSIKVADSQRAPEPIKNRPPPPPNEAPPSSGKQEPLVVGISMSSTTTAGGFAAPVGNTLYGKTPVAATQPSQVKPYLVPRYTPIYQVDSEPVVIGEVKIPYPDKLRSAGIEGSVVLTIAVDASGSVVAAKVIQGPHPGLNDAALQAIRKFRFKPAIKNGEAVSTEVRYTYTFLLD